MNQSQIQESAVQCDKVGCGWIQYVPWGKVPNWHKKACPKCGNGEIVSDDDFIIWGRVNTALQLDKMIDPDCELPRETVIIDTSKTRA